MQKVTYKIKMENTYGNKQTVYGTNCQVQMRTHETQNIDGL
jgi:hypothetical protein